MTAVGFCFTDDDYQNGLPTACGGMDSGGLVTAAKCKIALLRPYYKGNPTPAALAAQIEHMETVARAQRPNGVRYYVVGNEPNLPIEQWQGGLPAYEQFYDAVLAALPPILAERCCWAGMSPGMPGYEAWISASTRHKCAAVVAHVYGRTLAELQSVATTAENLAGTTPLIMGECNFGPGAGITVYKNAWADNVWGPFIDWLRARKRWIAALYFAYSWHADMPLGTPPDAVGTRIVPVTIKKALEEAVTEPARNYAPQGRAWWIWYVQNCGGWQGIVDFCRRSATTNVFVKAGDGPALWDQFTTDLVNTLRAAGLHVYAWHYAYLGRIDGSPHGSAQWTVQDEVNVVRQIIDRGGANLDGFISDVEAEAEGRAQEADDYAQAVRAMLPGKFFGYAPLPVIDYHQELPYLQFNKACDAVLPQFYSRALGSPWDLQNLMEQWSRWSATWAGWGVPCPTLMPVGQAYDTAVAADLRAFEATANEHEWASWSYWSLEHAIQLGLVDAVVPPQPQQPDQLADILSQVYTQQQRAFALGTPVGVRLGHTLSSAIDAAKYTGG